MHHLTVTNLKRMGMPDTAIQAYIGWSTLDMVNIYSDLDPEEQFGSFF